MQYWDSSLLEWVPLLRLAVFLLHSAQMVLLLAFAVLILGLGEISLAGFGDSQALSASKDIKDEIK